jgi:hypothetical protein
MVHIAVPPHDRHKQPGRTSLDKSWAADHEAAALTLSQRRRSLASIVPPANSLA